MHLRGALDEARNRQYWDNRSAAYSPDSMGPWMRLVHQRQHEAALTLAPVRPGDRALDAGAGTGLLTARLLAAGAAVTAVDRSPAMVEHLRRITPSAILADLSELELPEPFDAVFSIGVLNFVQDPADVMRRLCLLTRPGGALVVQVTELSLLGLGLWAYYRTLGIRPGLFSAAWLTEQAAQHGCRLIGRRHPLPHDLTIAFRRDG